MTGKEKHARIVDANKIESDRKKQALLLTFMYTACVVVCRLVKNRDFWNEEDWQHLSLIECFFFVIIICSDIRMHPSILQ